MIKLVCLDMDGVLVPPNNFWMELHKAFGTLDEGVEATKKYLNVDYAKLIEEVVVKMWKGKDATPYYALIDTMSYSAGIREFFAYLDRAKVPRAIISGGCYDLADRIAKEFGVDFIFANQLLIAKGKVSGEFNWPVGSGGYTKRQIIEQLCDDLEILPQEVLMIGDSDKDLESFRIVGTSIAFNCASKDLKAAATYVVESSDLRDIIPVLEKMTS